MSQATSAPVSAGALMIEAFCETLEEGLEEAGKDPNQRKARYQIGVLSELTREVTRVTMGQQLKDAAGPAISRVVETGKRVSRETQRVCQECDDLYDHKPPRTTDVTCGMCTGELAREEGA